ncbi:MAG: 5'/3'-nucleotidase SurE [Rikenellaceae bacterium]|jgi:5'-nucleotidase|nr:5'/3'-nucleotidase SurE [Rikenellaceae bacterium]
MERPLIFVTNDDGVGAKGLDYAIRVARRFGRVLAVAPEQTQSGMSHAITLFRPLYLRLVSQTDDVTVYACSGTPVDCVKMAFDYLLKDGPRPALAISGINHGSNSAVSVLYSGTMGAAIEASFYDCPSIGFSLLDHSPEADFEAAAVYAEKIMRKVLERRPSLPMCWNVNIPAVAEAEIKGIRMCRQNVGYWKEEFERRLDPRGKDYYWLTGGFYNMEPEATDTDEWALENNYVSIVPIHIDLTHYGQLDEAKAWF